MKKSEFIDQLNKRKLVIRGAGVLAKEFYESYGQVLRISYCTTNYPEESIDELTRIELDEIYEQKDDYFIIVCVGDYETVCYELISEGLMPEKDFSSAKIVAGLIENKKILLAVGQCELAVTDYIFQHMSIISKQYVTLYYDEYKVLGIADKKPLLHCVLEVNALIEMADYFIYPVNLTYRCEYYNRLLGKVRTDCCVVGVPLSTFEGYWPQDNAKDYYEKSIYYLTPDSLKIRRDMNIEKAFENGKNENILQSVLENDFYDDKTVKKCFEKTIKKFEILERKADVKISEYYKENYRSKKLFLDRGHAAPFVLKEYAKRILKSCDIDFELKEIEQVDLKWYEECHMEFPIYPSVRAQLNLTDKEKYRFIQNKEIFYLDFEAYIRIIYDYVKKGRMYLGEEQDEQNSMYSK